MNREEALQVLSIERDAILTPAQLRKRYLRSALTTHPDKNKNDADSAERFARLQQAYALLLGEVTDGAARAEEAAKTADLMTLLRRALRGENVEHELAQLGVHRPSTLFGVDLTVPFDRAPRAVAGSGGSGQRCADAEDAFRNAFQDEGLDEEGNPLEGWARPPVVDLEDL